MYIYWYMVKWQIYSLYGRLGFLILYCSEQGLHNVPVLIYTFMILALGEYIYLKIDIYKGNLYA